MKKGYYTDKQGNVLGYFELPEMPVNPDYIWTESESMPPIHVPPLTAEQEIAKLKAEIDEIEKTSLRKVYDGESLAEVNALRLSKRNRIYALEHPEIV